MAERTGIYVMKYSESGGSDFQCYDDEAIQSSSTLSFKITSQ